MGRVRHVTMEERGRPARHASHRTMVDIQEQDEWISYLSECKQLNENDIKRLCEKVRALG